MWRCCVDLSPPLYKVVVTVTTNFSKWNLQFFCVLWPKRCRKCDSGWGSAPDPPGGARDAPADPLVGWGGDSDTPPHTGPHPAPLAHRCSRLRRLDRRAPDTKSWRRHWSPPLFKVKLCLWPNRLEIPCYQKAGIWACIFWSLVSSGPSDMNFALLSSFTVKKICC